jgi:Flp pilus assembly protein TadG
MFEEQEIMHVCDSPHRPPRSRSGQSVVEFAVLLVVLLPIIVGAVDLVRAFYDYDVLAHAVNEGARRASFDSSSDNIKTAVQNASGTLAMQTSDVTVSCYDGLTTTSKTCSSVVAGDSLSVQGQFVFQPFTPWAASIMPGGQMTLTATAKRTYG